MLKIVMYVLNNFTFDARVHREAQSLAQKGHDVTVLALKDAHTPEREEIAGYKVERLDLKTRYWPKNGFFWVLKYIEFVWCCWQRTKAIKPHICHGNDMSGLIPAYLGARTVGAKVIYDSHELWLETNPIRKRSALEMKVWAWLERKLIKRVYRVITVSPWIAEELANKYQIQPPDVIMNCPPFEEIPRNNLIREKLALTSSDVIVLHHGGMARRRGIEEFILSGKYLPENYKLVLLGPESQFKEEQRCFVIQEQLEDKVFFLGPVPVDQVVRYVASADIGTFLSSSEVKSHRLGLANKVFECMSAGTPLVVSNFFEPFVRETGVGIGCRQEDPQEMARAFVKLWEDREGYDRAQQNCLKQAQKVYNWQAQAIKLEKIYFGATNQGV